MLVQMAGEMFPYEYWSDNRLALSDIVNMWAGFMVCWTHAATYFVRDGTATKLRRLEIFVSTFTMVAPYLQRNSMLWFVLSKAIQKLHSKLRRTIAFELLNEFLPQTLCFSFRVRIQFFAFLQVLMTLRYRYEPIALTAICSPDICGSLTAEQFLRF